MVFEIGCGVGNFIFPLICDDKDNRFFFYACDFSSRAIDFVKVIISNPFSKSFDTCVAACSLLQYSTINVNVIRGTRQYSPGCVALQQNALYDEQHCRAFHCDITQDDDMLANIEPESVDICTLIFVLSAINPNKMAAALQNILRVRSLTMFNS